MAGPKESVSPATLRAEVLSHATEDAEKVRELFSRLFGKGVTIKEEVLFGHYKNKIVKFSYRTDNGKEIGEILGRVKGVPFGTEGNKRAFFRLSKASLLLDGVGKEAGEGEPAVNIEASFRVFSGGSVEDYFKDEGRGSV